MKEKILHYFKEIVFFILFITLFANILSIYKSQEITANKLPNLPMRLIDNSLYKPHLNRPLVVHIWATWCPTCKMEIDNIERIAKNYDTITIAVKSGSDYEIENFLKSNNLSLKVINDRDGSLAQKFHIPAFPTTLIYNKKGELVFSEVGYTSTFGLYLRIWWASL